MSIDILVVGDANPDLIVTGDTVPRFGQAEQMLESADLVLGGSAAIVACGLAGLGVSTALTAVVGDDEFGRFTRSALDARGVDGSSIRGDGTASTGLSVILAQPHDRAILTLPGTIPLLDAATVADAVARLAPRHVHVASYFLQPALTAALPALLAQLKAAGVTTSLDTNWDPAERWSGLGEVLPHVDVFLPNREEALAIAGALTGERFDDVVAAATAIAAHGPRVVVKAGADGGISVDGDGAVVRAPGLVLEVLDTTGAGDSFDAGYLAAMIAGASEPERVRWAAVAGSLSTRGAGGTARQADRAELLAALPTDAAR